MGLELAKVGDAFLTTALRTVLFQNQGSTIYDIWAIHYSYSNVNELNGNDVIMAALSLKDQDQVQDTTAIGFDSLHEDPGYFGVWAHSIDLETEGGVSLLGQSDQYFMTKPFTIPFAAWVVNPALAATARLSIEVYYERRQVTSMEKARVVGQTGGKARTS